MRLRLRLAYDGTAYAGWARQSGQATVQEVVELALSTVLRTEVRTTVAGRTDTGVHARGQVCHADVPGGALTAAGEGERLVRRLAGVLPPDVRVHAVDRAEEGFDARFSALWRRYCYRVSDGPVDPLTRRHVLAWDRPLDPGRMHEAAQQLLGQRDFAAYCRRREGATTIRTLEQLDVARDGDLVRVDVQADAFCHSMVRSLVGALLVVGDGRKPVTWPAEVLASGERTGVTVAPAHGLVLEEVGYPPATQLAERAQQTRAVRRPLA